MAARRKGWHRGHVVGVAPVVLAAASCSDLTLYDHAVAAVIVGSVVDQGNVGVAGASITVKAYRDADCDSPDALGSFPGPITHADGSFETTLLVPLSEPFTACLVVGAEAPLAAGLKPDSVRGALLDLVYEGQVMDTAFVDVILMAH